MGDHTPDINQKGRKKVEIKLNLAKLMVYVPKLKPRQTIQINEKKLTITAYPPNKKPITKPKKKNIAPKRIWNKKK